MDFLDIQARKDLMDCRDCQDCLDRKEIVVSPDCQDKMGYLVCQDRQE